MTAWAVQIVFYAALAIWATWVSWRHPAGVVGLTLILCSVVSNVSYFGASFMSRLTLELIQAVIVMNSARIAFKSTPSWHSAIVTGLAAIDATFCGVIAVSAFAPAWQSYIFGWFTNGVFLIQCLCVAAPGVRDALVARRVDIRTDRHLDHARVRLDGRGHEGGGR